MSDFPILSPNSDSCTKKSLPFLGLFALSAISITFSRDRFSVSSAFANGAASSPRTHVVNHPLRWRYEISAAAIGLLVSLLVVGSAALISVPTGVVRTTAATPTSSSSTTFANAPRSLQQAILATPSIARTLHHTSSNGLRVTFSPNAIHLNAGTVNASVGVATFGRSASTQSISHLASSTGGRATYVARGASEQLVHTASGLEQTFHIASRPVGTGNLRIGIPLANVMASGRGAALTLTRLDGRQVGSYSGLVVRDATGRLVPSIMFYSAPRHQVIIDVFDGHARYPLSIDPTWNMASSAIPDPVAAAQDQFGISVAISGTNAVVGARGTNNSRGAVYFYSLVGGAWTLNTASTTGTTPGEIIDPAATNNDFFGYSVAISGTNAVVGAFYTSTRRGAAYFYSLVAGVWTRNTEVTDPAATSGDQFGVSVAISGTNAVIGAYVTGDDDGAVYFYSLVGGTWTLNTASGTSGEVTVLGATNLGISVAISGTNAVAGAFATDSNEGAAYFFSLVAGTWSPSGGIDDPAVTGGDYFGYSVAISGTNAVDGA